MSVVRWEDPPAHDNFRQGQSSQWPSIAAELRARPGVWAAIAEGGKHGTVSGWANRIRNGHIPAFRPVGHFEARTVSSGGTAALYARYVGEVASA